jgi:hypothetical protein
MGQRSRVYDIFSVTKDKNNDGEIVVNLHHSFDDLDKARQYHKDADRSDDQKYALQARWK